MKIHTEQIVFNISSALNLDVTKNIIKQAKQNGIQIKYRLPRFVANHILKLENVDFNGTEIIGEENDYIYMPNEYLWRYQTFKNIVFVNCDFRQVTISNGVFINCKWMGCKFSPKKDWEWENPPEFEYSNILSLIELPNWLTDYSVAWSGFNSTVESEF